MDNNFDLLKKLDNDELYNKTYITIDNLEAIKNKKFQAFSRFKLMGFIDILSKRLELDLSELRKEAEDYFDSVEPVVQEEPMNNPIILNDRNKRMVFGLVATIIGILIVVFLYFRLSSDKDKELTDIEVSPPSSVVVTPPIEQIIENNISVEENSTENNSSFEASKSIEPAIEQNGQKAVAGNYSEIIKIVPTKKVWIGIINLDTKEKKEHITSDELVIDTSINQIIVINGAYLSLIVGNEEKRYDFDGRVRFLCKDGKIKEIKFAEFKALNDGKAWN
ncbi:MAG: hypothetical protein RBT59_05885 [Arcobacteraceae bacterium]|nr:hypothetical protein [Arcobacteraceae bacterium]